jgi:hypothetical protein
MCLSNPIDVDDPGPGEDFNDSDSDCGYTGGVNVSCQQSGLESHYEPSEDEWENSDTESLAELEGDELEQNLQNLRKEAKRLSAPT